ncbi:60S ribosomal protein L32 [Pseudocyphellaria aurata]|nr:60S ribosomal protein L32 [Pseudocyphellaria aurata]
MARFVLPAFVEDVLAESMTSQARSASTVIRAITTNALMQAGGNQRVSTTEFEDASKGRQLCLRLWYFTVTRDFEPATDKKESGKRAMIQYFQVAFFELNEVIHFRSNGCSMVQIGYGSNKKTRHLMPSGHKAFLVHNSSDVDLLLMHNKTFAAEISHAVSSRKRVEIVAKARQLGVKVTNAKARVTTES